MKKLILWAAALAVVTSCAKNEAVDVNSSSATIGFSTLNDRVTNRVANTNADATNDNYIVYAAVTNATDGWYIMGEELVASTNLYANTSRVDYWPSSGTLDLYAYAPADNVTCTPELSDRALKLEYIVSGDADKDFTIATPITAASYANSNGSDADATNDGTVDFTFAHKLSKATINVTLDSTNSSLDDYTFTFSSVDFTVLYDSLYVDAVSPTTISVDQSQSFASNSVINYDDFTYLDDNTTTTATLGTTYAYSFTGAKEIFFTPHDDGTTNATGCTITLNDLFIKNGNDATVLSGDVTYTLTSSTSFSAGTQYLFTITLSTDNDDLFGDPIKFTSDDVDWGSPSTGVTIN